jgi:hypothetical protein
MKRTSFILGIGILAVLFSCTKEYSLENSGNANNPLIVGNNCRINKIVYFDSATGLIGLGSIAAIINPADQVPQITKFDSLSATIDFQANLTYIGDTIYINPDEYFLVDVLTQRISRLHGLIDPTIPSSLQFDADYSYNAAGYLVQKSYSLTSLPGVPYYIVNYTYFGTNLVHMSSTEQTTGDLISDADIDYYNNLTPRAFWYLFPDELSYTHYNQFLNFGNKPTNAVKSLKVRYYDPGNVLRDSTVSTFTSYNMSLDNYVLSVMMTGDDQYSIPAPAGKLVFSYKCK